MTVLKYDDVIKKSHDLDNYFSAFWKILSRASLMQRLTMLRSCMTRGIGSFTPKFI